jgi:osmotically inducible protein OsmC
MKRTSTVTWKGAGKQGKGYITSQSHELNNAYYAWNTRFENEKGTNPEELIAAAHAACFTMKLSFLIEKIGFVSDLIETTAEVSLQKDAIGHSHLIVNATIPDITKQQFEECATNAKFNCPVSRALNITITMDATLNVKTPQLNV